MESFYKLRPDQDLQCYFEMPSAIAALSNATATSFQLSGDWRQQGDWAVIEWTRDNPIDHPRWRNLPDGDLSGLTLQYEERRENCIPIDSSLFPTVEWDQLRVWTEYNGVHAFHRVPLLPYAEPVVGAFTPATCSFTLSGTVSTGDYVGISWHTEHRTHQAYWDDTPETIVQAIAAAVNAFPGGMTATANGSTLELAYVGFPGSPGYRHPGANGNRVGVYAFVVSGSGLSWNADHAVMSGGTSPEEWRITLPFASIPDVNGNTIDWAHVRKMRWTYAAPLSYGAFERQEFAIHVRNWSVNGAGAVYQVAGPGSRRIEDDDARLTYSGAWNHAKGNYSGGSIHWTSDDGALVRCRYYHPQAHELYLGTRIHGAGGSVTLEIDEDPALTLFAGVAGEDALVRRRAAALPAGEHDIVIRKGSGASTFYFDFLEIAHPVSEVAPLPLSPQISLSTDFDTYHSLTIPAERTVALMTRMGFGGRVNHYVGAMWFYQLRSKGFAYAEETISFSGQPEFGATTELRIGNEDYGPEFDTIFTHLNRVGDTAASIATAFALRINDGSTAIRAETNGSILRIVSRRLGVSGNKITISASSSSPGFTAQASGPKLSGGTDGLWVTDLDASPKLNRAMRDWHLAFFGELSRLGIDCVTAYSTELMHGDDSVQEGIAQRYWDGNPVLLNTPALQTNFSPRSLDFWKEIHRESAELMAVSGITPYMQLGEVQYWYFPNPSGMPYYDEDAKSAFLALHGRPMARIVDQYQPTEPFLDELQFLQGRLGAFCTGVMNHVRSHYPNARFEVLYPPDVNESSVGPIVNFPDDSWTPAALTCLKTESFIYTLTCNLEKSRFTINVSADKGFPKSQRAHLVGIGDYSSSWRKELFMASEEGLESVTLFALDQMSLIGYPVPIAPRRISATFQG